MRVIKVWVFVFIFAFFSASKAEALSLVGTTVGSFHDGRTIKGQTAQFDYSNRDLGGNATVSWLPKPGVGINPPRTSSSMGFDGVGSDAPEDWATSVGSPFSLGAYSYTNGKGETGAGAYSVGLDLDLNAYLATTNGPHGGDANISLQLNVNETPNVNGDPRISADSVTIQPTNRVFLFTYLNVNYFLEILGFSADAGRTYSSVLSANEGVTTTSGLYARIVTSPIPEPTTSILLGSGLVGLVTRMRKTRQIRG